MTDTQLCRDLGAVFKELFVLPQVVGPVVVLLGRGAVCPGRDRPVLVLSCQHGNFSGEQSGPVQSPICPF